MNERLISEHIRKPTMRWFARHRWVRVWAATLLVVIPAACERAGGDAVYPITTAGSGNAVASTSASAPVEEVIPDDGVVLSRHWEGGRDIVPSVLVTAEQAKEIFHFRITRKAGRTVKLEGITPAGKVSWAAWIDFLDNGARRMRAINAHGVEAATDEMLASGFHTRRLRSGSPSTQTGCFAVQNRFDAKGQVVEGLCLDEAGNPAANDDGCEMVRLVRNGRGWVEKSSCHNANGDPIRGSDGVHAEDISLDPFGRDIEHVFLDVTGSRSARTTDGCWGWKNLYNRAGKRVKGTCVDAKGQPSTIKGAVHASYVTDFDENGCETRNRFLDRDGSPAGLQGVFEMVTQRNEACDALRFEQRDARGDAAVGDPLSTPSYESKFDAEGNETERKCFDAKGAPINCNPEARVNSARVNVILRKTFDSRGRRISEKHFDEQGAPSPEGREYPHEERLRWNDSGLLMERMYFDEKGRPAAGVGVHRFESTYDSMGVMTSDKAFGLHGEPVTHAFGYHEVRFLLDSQHRRVRVEFRGVEGQLSETAALQFLGVNWPKGTAFLSIERAGVVSNTFYDRAGKVIQRIACTNVDIPCVR